MAKVIWTKLAVKDLRNIYEFIAKDSKQYAAIQVGRIINRVEQLEEFQQSGRVVPEFENELIRELIEGNYRIVYRIESDDVVGIVRIHHSARLISN